MYLIHFKKKIAPVEVERETGDALKAMRERGASKDTLVDLNGLQVELGQIDVIEPTRSRNSEQKNNPDLIPLTEEQLAHARENIMRVGKDLREKGVIGSKKQLDYRKDVVWHKFCVECGSELPPGLARVCSSSCYLKNPLVV